MPAKVATVWIRLVDIERTSGFSYC